MGVILRRSALALLLAAAIVALASAGLYVASAPPVVSLLIEPVSLLLMPGLVIALVAAGAHDFSALSVVLWSLLIYAVVFYFALRYRASARIPARFR